MKTVTFNTNEKGLLTVMKDYQVVAMRHLWSLEEGIGASSRDVWVASNVALRDIKTISRASIINFLNAMVDDGLLGFHEITGKGGHRRIYKALFDGEGSKLFLAMVILKTMGDEWPSATKKVLNKV